MNHPLEPFNTYENCSDISRKKVSFYRFIQYDSQRNSKHSLKKNIHVLYSPDDSKEWVRIGADRHIQNPPAAVN